jgi:hypothetical protein
MSALSLVYALVNHLLDLPQRMLRRHARLQIKEGE